MDAVSCLAMSVSIAGMDGLQSQCSAAVHALSGPPASTGWLLAGPLSVCCCGLFHSMTPDCCLLLLQIGGLQAAGGLCHAGFVQALLAATFCRVATCQWPAQVTGNWQKAEQLAGRLRLCSKSLFFDADDARAPIIRCALPPGGREGHYLAAASTKALLRASTQALTQYPVLALQGHIGVLLLACDVGSLATVCWPALLAQEGGFAVTTRRPCCTAWCAAMP